MSVWILIPLCIWFLMEGYKNFVAVKGLYEQVQGVVAFIVGVALALVLLNILR